MNFGKLENILGHEFSDRGLLERAVTHRSWAHENMPGETDEKIRDAQNESLEFVGDSVVGLVIAETLFRMHPEKTEGDLTLMKHRLVSTTTMAEIAHDLGLGEFIRLGRGEEKTGGRDKPALLADALEAVVGAVFFDGGYEKAAGCVNRIFSGSLETATPAESNDFKTMLQEKLQAQRLQAPTYSLLKTEGMPHARTFFVEAVWDGGRSVGKGRSIKAAEMVAASEALNALREKETGDQK